MDILNYINEEFEIFESEVIDQDPDNADINKVVFTSGAFSMALYFLDELNGGASHADLTESLVKFIDDLSNEIIEGAE